MNYKTYSILFLGILYSSIISMEYVDEFVFKVNCSSCRDIKEHANYLPNTKVQSVTIDLKCTLF